MAGSQTQPAPTRVVVKTFKAQGIEPPAPSAHHDSAHPERPGDLAHRTPSAHHSTIPQCEAGAWLFWSDGLSAWGSMFDGH